jgi:hypothetical protein
MKRRYVWIVAGCMLLAFVAMQFVPVHRANRLGVGDPDAPREVMYVLRRACYDCHSTETRWPLWAYVAPMSWRVVNDVDRARRVLNFSDWAGYDTATQAALRSTIGWTTETHRMPLWYYVTLHPDARLSDSDLAALGHWARGTSAVR